jgi:peptidoglycan-N-acetylglucosamine deacetylase
MNMRTGGVRASVGLSALAILVGAAHAAPAPCPGNADALGTARVLTVDAAATPRVGRKHFPQTLPLEPKEIVLTFDDGPEPGTTARVLDALKPSACRPHSSCSGGKHSPTLTWPAAS